MKIMLSWVRRYGLSETRFSSCVKSGRYAKPIRDAVAAAIKAGFRFTPSIVIGGTVYEGYIGATVITALIREQLRPGLLERMWPINHEASD